MNRTLKFAALVVCACLIVLNGQVVLAQGNETALHQIGGTLPGTLTFVPYGSGPMDVNTLGVATGQLKSIGQATVFIFQKPTPDGRRVVDGHFWIVTPNGDKIKGVYEGTNSPGTEPGQLIGTADWQVSGGTGRFANASGTIHATAYVTMLGFGVFEWPFYWVLEGEIEY